MVTNAAQPGCLQVRPVVKQAAEFAGPAWVFGMQSFTLLPGSRWGLAELKSDSRECGHQPQTSH